MIHSKLSSRIRLICSLVLLMGFLAGCDCFPCGSDISAPFTQSYIQLAPIAPPPTMFEQVPENKNPRGQIWRPGYWAYSGSNYYWVSGEWIARPSPTALWSADHWIKHTYGWGFVPGYWQ